jgi:hypothetical protein
MNNKAVPVGGVGTLFMACGCGLAHADEGPDLAQLVQNPIAKVISLPFQNNLTFGVGPDHDPQDVLNIQPVLPIQINDDWQAFDDVAHPHDAGNWTLRVQFQLLFPK